MTPYRTVCRLDNYVRGCKFELNVSDKSLQINLNTLDDAKALIQNLGFVKKAYDAHHCTSILLVINEAAVVEIEEKIKGIINWTKTYREVEKLSAKDKSVRILLPHYREFVSRHSATELPSESQTEPLPKRRMGRKPGWQPPGKTQPLVPADMAGT